MASIFLFLLVSSCIAQQKQTFDMATFRAPEGWHNVGRTSSAVLYAIANHQRSTYAQIAIYAGAASMGSLHADFENEWQELIVNAYSPTAAPQLVPAESGDGWSALAGIAPFEFDGALSAAMLLTTSGFGRCLSVAVLTNTGEFDEEIQAFLESVDLSEPEGNAEDDSNPSGVAACSLWTDPK